MADQNEGPVTEPRRKDDPENDDWTDQRDTSTDWKLAPRWALVTAIGGLLALCGWLVGRNSNLESALMLQIEKHNSDKRWEMLSALSETQAIHGAQIRHHDAQLQQLTKLADDISDIRGDVRVLKRLAEENRR